jgi:hypothetical protein
VKLGGDRGRQEGLGREKLPAVQAWLQAGNEKQMVVACPELLLPATSLTTSPSCCRRPGIRSATAGDPANTLLPGKVPLHLLLHPFLPTFVYLSGC